MAMWIEQVAAEAALRPVLYQADVRNGSYAFGRRWLRVLRPSGEEIVITFERHGGESETRALDRMSRTLSVRLGIVEEL